MRNRSRGPNRKWTVRVNGVFVSDHYSEAAAYGAATDAATDAGQSVTVTFTDEHGTDGPSQVVGPLFRSTCVCGFKTNALGTKRAADDSLAVHQKSCRQYRNAQAR